MIGIRKGISCSEVQDWKYGLRSEGMKIWINSKRIEYKEQGETEYNSNV